MALGLGGSAVAVRGAADFFVAGRRLGPGLIFSTMLAANIGAGSTVGATGIGYSHGVSAWWWVGSAALGSIVLAFWIGPSLRRVAAAHQLNTVGDYLEFRYSGGIRGAISGLLWFGTIAILAGQLIAVGTILEAVISLPFALGCAAGGAIIVVYFGAGGLLTSARVNVVQLAVKLGGFAIAAPLALEGIGGWSALRTVHAPDPAYWTFWRGGPPGIMYLALLGPAFFLSPGLLQKVFGARDDRAVRVGVGLNTLGLLGYAGVPALLGIVARARFPELQDEKLALPMLLIRGLPPPVGAIGLAAVFSAEISAADAALFMLTTSLSQDLYKRFVNPAATDLGVLRVARWTTLVSGGLAVALALASASIVDVLDDLLHCPRRRLVRTDRGWLVRRAHDDQPRVAGHHRGGRRSMLLVDRSPRRRARLGRDHAGAGRLAGFERRLGDKLGGWRKVLFSRLNLRVLRVLRGGWVWFVISQRNCLLELEGQTTQCRHIELQ